MERRENKKRGREGEARTTMKTCSDSNVKKGELLLSGNSCLWDSRLEEGEQSNEHRPRKVCEYEDGNESAEVGVGVGVGVGVFDFPWLKEGTTSKGYYDDDDYKCRLEFEDLVAGCWSGAYDGSSWAASTCLQQQDFSDFMLDQQDYYLPSDDHRLSSRTTTATSRLDNDDRGGGELPILRDKNVEELDGIWSSVLDQPLDNNIFTFHKL